jgi:tetratricopeptide (TPR) repeat protein
MRTSLLALSAFALCASSGLAQTGNNDAPPACQRGASGAVDYQACVDAAPRGSPARLLALINLGTQAYLRQDITDAVRFFDQAQTESGGQIYSDPSFHAYRADAYARVGRDADALANAQTAWQLLTRPPDSMRADLAASPPSDPEVVYGLILPILKKGGDPHFAEARAAFEALPIQDYHSYANRSAVIDQLGDHEAALRQNAQALALAPNDPQVLNNQCYFLAELGRGNEALPYCTHALQIAPDVAPIHDSYAAALAAAGRCEDANRERAAAHQLDPATQDYQQPLACTPAAR